MFFRSLILCGLSLFSLAGAASLPHGLSGAAFLKRPDVQSRLVNLMGTRHYRQLVSSYVRVGTLQDDAHVTAYVGCAENACGTNDAIVIFSRDTQAFTVLQHVDSQPFGYQERGKVDTSKYSPELKSSLMNLYGALKP